MVRMKKVTKWLVVLYFNIIGLGFVWSASVPTSEAITIVSAFGSIACLLLVMALMTKISGFWKI